MDTPTGSNNDGTKPAAQGAIMSLQSFPLFSALPLELRLQIWEEALPPRTIKFEPSFCHLLVSGATNYHLPAVDRANFEGRSVATRRRLMVEGRYNCIYRMDPKIDILRVSYLDLPVIVPTTVWPLPNMSSRALPIRKLQSCASLGKDFPADDINIHLPRPMDQGLDLEALPVLEEWTMVGRDWDVKFWLAGYQVHGPEILNQPDHDSLWEWLRGDGEFVERAAPYFERRGYTGDTGIRWPAHEKKRKDFAYPIYKTGDFSSNAPRMMEAGRRGARILKGNPHLWNMRAMKLFNLFRPNIGFMGYSSGAVSSGGQWAGFLYFVETKKVYFTPLAWYEVKDALEANHEPMESFHDLVARVFIVHPGQKAPQAPHYAWEEVKPFHVKDTIDMRKIRTLWVVLTHVFNNTQRFWSERMRLDP